MQFADILSIFQLYVSQYNMILLLFQLILNNLRKFEIALRAEKPLFQVETLLAPPDVVLHPQANEVYKLTLQCVRDCVEG